MYHGGRLERTASLPPKSTAPYLQGQRHLLDDSVLEDSPCPSSQGSVNATGEISLSTMKNKCEKNIKFTGLLYVLFQIDSKGYFHT